MTTLKDNILSCYLISSEEERRNGLIWYNEAHSFSSFLAEKYGVSQVVTCGIIAALSPLKSWESNKIIADQYFNGIYKHTKVQIGKCKEIQKQDSYIKTINILGGLKTQNFFQNIFDPTNPRACTIDRHIISSTFGYKKDSISDKEYNLVKGLYLEVAKEVNLIPCQLQACIWLGVRNRKKN